MASLICEKWLQLASGYLVLRSKEMNSSKGKLLLKGISKLMMIFHQLGIITKFMPWMKEDSCLEGPIWSLYSNPGKLSACHRTSRVSIKFEPSLTFILWSCAKRAASKYHAIFNRWYNNGQRLRWDCSICVDCKLINDSSQTISDIFC